jgi:uncharacterized protein YuzE
MKIKIVGTEDKIQGRLYKIEVAAKEVELLLTWHSLERIGVWSLKPEQVLETLLFPEEVVTGHNNRFIAHKRYNDTLKVVETLQIKYSPVTDALIIRLREGIPVDSVDLAEGIIAHYSKDKKILEIEILDASKVVQMNELNVSLKSAQAAVA